MVGGALGTRLQGGTYYWMREHAPFQAFHTPCPASLVGAWPPHPGTCGGPSRRPPRPLGPDSTNNSETHIDGPPPAPPSSVWCHTPGVPRGGPNTHCVQIQTKRTSSSSPKVGAGGRYLGEWHSLCSRPTYPACTNAGGRHFERHRRAGTPGTSRIHDRARFLI